LLQNDVDVFPPHLNNVFTLLEIFKKIFWSLFFSGHSVHLCSLLISNFISSVKCTTLHATTGHWSDQRSLNTSSLTVYWQLTNADNYQA